MSSKAEKLAAEVTALDALDLPALRDRWLTTFGNPAPSGLNRNFLIKALAFDLRDKAGLGFSPAFKRQLKQIAAEMKADRDGGPAPSTHSPAPPTLTTGTRLMREWNGQTHIVEVLEDGFAWRGKTYSSLTATAFAITGQSWSGPRFFGLHDKRQRSQSVTFSSNERAAL